MLRAATKPTLVRVHMSTRRQKRSTRPLTVLGSGQNPQPTKSSINPYDIDRKTDCASHNACLNYAFQCRWSSFGCGSCTSYEKAEPVAIAGGNQWEGA